ncbi:hypothetical protein MLC59_05425 [Marinobacter bryozoorum]|uniref:hypothetical protein n=1 Tax=Marinobacter bryozoorum TaxID=256324 RepID=UPI002004FF4B|nr:hypothetical protein [Marinobacter bryozoorum]MCK7543604.1 hypothetical protein [Marinobacter bryozoorum]
MAGTPIARVEIGGAHIVLPIKHTENKKLVTLKGPGAGFGLGASISVPFVNGSYSHEDFPASKIGSIYQGLSRPNRGVYTEADFNGGVLVKTLTAGKQISANVSAAMWFDAPVEACMARMSCSREEFFQIMENVIVSYVRGKFNAVGVGVHTMERFMKSVKAVGFFSGLSLETQLIGASVDAFVYNVSSS